MKLSRWLVLAAALTAAAAAQAATGVGRTQISGLSFGVVDLDTTDGLAPSFSAVLQSSALTLHIDHQGGELQFTDNLLQGDTANYHFNRGGSSAGFETNGAGNYTFEGAIVQGLDFGSRASAGLSQVYEVTLSAHSQLTLTGHLTESAAPHTGYTTVPLGAGYFSLSVWSSAAGPGKYFNRSVNLFTDESAIDEDFAFTYANTTNQDITFRLNLGAGAYGYIQVVPEPSTYAMLLGGLGVAGVFARRRRQAA